MTKARRHKAATCNDRITGHAKPTQA